MQFAGLASGDGRLLQHLWRRAPGDADLAVVLSDAPDASALDWAAKAGLATEAVEPTTVESVRDRAAHVAETLADYEVDLVCLDGYDGPMTGPALDALPVTLDIHRSLLPAFPGDDPVRSALAAGVAVTGATVHAVTDPDNAGHRPIVTQEPVPVYADDDGESLERRVLEQGATGAYSRAVRWFAEGDITVDREAGEVRIDADTGGRFPARRIASHDRRRELRYGENPHQRAAVYADAAAIGPSVVDAEQVNPHAKALSYNNYNDADAALALVREFGRPAAAVIKHANPAGCAVAETIADAYDRALRTDPMSAFGGIVALNRPCDVPTAERIVDSYKEVVVAPGHAAGAADVLAEREDLRVLAVGPLDAVAGPGADTVEQDLAGGRLVQDRDDQSIGVDDLEVVTERAPTEAERETMAFAWPVVKHTKSNAVVLATGTETVGVGMGQVSRVDAVRLAAMKATEHAEDKGPEGAVMASDAFFPFPDGVEVAAEAGVEAVVQPGGSVNDDDVIAAADDHGLAMAFTGQRAFRHG